MGYLHAPLAVNLINKAKKMYIYNIYIRNELLNLLTALDISKCLCVMKL
jgi:hypothetical protein